MMSVNFADVYIRSRKSYMDVSTTAYVEKHNECQRTMAWWTQHEDGDEFMYMDLLFCDDIQIIFITDYYGFNFHSFEEEVEYCPELYHQQPETYYHIREIKNILKKMYPTYKVYLYNKGHYKNLQETSIQKTWDRLEATGMDMIPDIEQKLFAMTLPMWSRYFKKQSPKRWETHQLYRTSFENAMELFYYQWENLKAMDDAHASSRTDFLGTISHVVCRP